jgi:hypothetical protein
VLACATAAFTVVICAVLVYGAYKDHGDASPSNNLIVWIVPFTVLSWGLSLAVGLWLLMDINERVKRIEVRG